MDGTIFRRFASIAYEKAGIELKDGKESLVKARISKRLRALGMQNESQYLQLLESGASSEELTQFIDAISTNHTHFFREPEHFALLAEHCRAWLLEGQTRFRFWSAAASSGEEPYSMAIVLHELFGEAPVDYSILATDISMKCLAKARNGTYTERGLEHVTKIQKMTYFMHKDVKRTGEATYRVNPALQDHILFARLNLASPPFPMHGPFDAIFCRNVMIYLNHDVCQQLVLEFERLLRPNGYLFIGHAETLSRVRTALQLVKPAVYVKG